MGRPPRLLVKDAFYHVFNRGVEKRPIVFDDHDRHTFLFFLSQIIEKYQLVLYAFCLMTNHYHLYVSTPLANLDEAIQLLQGQHARHINLRHDRAGALFQGRYKSPVVESDMYSMALTRYIHRNPLEAQLVANLETYPWSSYSSYLNKTNSFPWVNTQWILRQLGKDAPGAQSAFRAFHENQPTEKEIKMFSSKKPYCGTRTFYESFLNAHSTAP